jgi:pantothenate synthetase
VFVNPTQFAPTEDLSKYPRTWDHDVACLRRKACDAVFVPTASAMYPAAAPYRTFVSQTDVDTMTPEGTARPGFFRGVATVVTKLFSIVQPTHAVFGQKDGIQCIVVRTLVRDLNLPINIVVAPTTRESDGLAMSSRNVYLTKEQRKAAPAIFSGLSAAQQLFEQSPAAKEFRVARQAARAQELSGAEAELRAQQAAVAHTKATSGAAAPTSRPQLCDTFASIAARFEHAIRVEGQGQFGEIQYVTFSDALTGAPITDPSQSKARNGAIMLSVAVKIGATRLLDNIMLTGSLDDIGMPESHVDY